MAGNTNYPTSMDDDSSLFDVTDGSTTLLDEHHNNLKEAVKAIEDTIGIRGTSVPTSLDYRLGNPTGAHNHNGASGMGVAIAATRIYPLSWQQFGSVPSGVDLGIFSFGRTAQIVSVQGNLRLAPGGATLAFDIKVGATSLWKASMGLRPIFPDGSNQFLGASPNLVTYPSGAQITISSQQVGITEPGRDLALMFVFRE